MNSQTLLQIRFHSVLGFSNAKIRFPPKKGKAFLVSLGTQTGTQTGTQMERKRSVTLFLSSTVALKHLHIEEQLVNLQKVQNTWENMDVPA